MSEYRKLITYTDYLQGRDVLEGGNTNKGRDFFKE
jgi:hypothetical protein